MRRSHLLIVSLAALLVACTARSDNAMAQTGESTSESSAMNTGSFPSALEKGHEVAVFAGGCFWCVESEFDHLPGVIAAVSGYTGGSEQHPTYSQVSSKKTGHTEAVGVVYDPKVVTYAQLLDIFWHNIDPFQVDGQFCDHGKHYRSGIFYEDESQRLLAESTRSAVERRFRRKVVTEVTAAGTFWPAEEDHQDFHTNHPVHYRSYRAGCGRDRRLAELWGSHQR